LNTEVEETRNKYKILVGNVHGNKTTERTETKNRMILTCSFPNQLEKLNWIQLTQNKVQ
jgi:hypothetical protein